MKPKPRFCPHLSSFDPCHQIYSIMPKKSTHRVGRPLSRVRTHRIITKNVASVVLSVRRFFEIESTQGARLGRKKVVARTCAATGLSPNIVCKIKADEDLDLFPENQKESRDRKMEVPLCFGPIIRLLMRDILLEDHTIPSLSNIWNRLKTGNFDIFEGLDKKPMFSWSIETLRRFMLRIGFVYSKRPNHYAYTKERHDIMQMRHNYLDWIEAYRKQGYRIFWQDEKWVFKNMAQNKI